MQRHDPDLLAAVSQLALPDAHLAVAPDRIVITDHAIRRYRERVERVPRRLAVRRIEELAALADWRARPLPWTRVVLHPGVIYGYSSVRPDVCLFAREGVLVTVMSRKFICGAVTREVRAAA